MKKFMVGLIHGLLIWGAYEATHYIDKSFAVIFVLLIIAGCVVVGISVYEIINDIND